MIFSMPVWRYPMTGLSETTVSPSSSMIRRSTPWVEGCCGPMLMVMVLNSGAVVADMRGGALGGPRIRRQHARHRGRLPRSGGGAGRPRRLDDHGRSRVVALQAHAVDLFLELHDAVDQGLGPRRAAGD